VRAATPPPSFVSIDATANAALALGGTGDHFGGALGVELALGAHFGLRADLGLGLGAIDVIDARSVVLDLAPGIAWLSNREPEVAPLALELRLSLGAHYLAVVRPAEAGFPAEQRARFLPAARLLVGGLWWFSREFALLANVGVDGAMGETEIVRMGTRISTLEPFALSMQLGVRARL
jgi:hypothetical protein